MTPTINGNRRQLEIGTTIHFSQTIDDPTADIPLLQSVGVDSYRDDFTWKNVETTLGVYSPNATAAKMMAAISNKTMHPFIVLAYDNSLYGGGFPVTQEAIDAYCRYVKWVVSSFPHIRYAAIWNEPNLYSPTWGGPVTAAQYITLLGAAYSAIKSVNSSVQVVGGEIAVKDTTWTQDFINGGGLDYCDVLGIHVYNNNVSPPTAIDWIRARQADCVAKIGKYKPMIVSECGYSTYTSGVSEAVQADFLTQYMRLAKALPYIQALYWFELRDFGTDQSQRENCWGIRTAANAEKQAWASFRDEISLR